MKTKVMIIGYAICVAGLIGGAFARTAGELIVTQGVMYADELLLIYLEMIVSPTRNQLAEVRMDLI